MDLICITVMSGVINVYVLMLIHSFCSFIVGWLKEYTAINSVLLPEVVYYKQNKGWLLTLPAYTIIKKYLLFS